MSGALIVYIVFCPHAYEQYIDSRSFAQIQTPTDFNGKLIPNEIFNVAQGFQQAARIGISPRYVHIDSKCDGTNLKLYDNIQTSVTLLFITKRPHNEF